MRRAGRGPLGNPGGEQTSTLAAHPVPGGQVAACKFPTESEGFCLKLDVGDSPIQSSTTLKFMVMDGSEPEMAGHDGLMRAIVRRLPFRSILAAASLATAPFSGFLYRNRELTTVGDLWRYVVIYVCSLLVVVVGISLVFGRRAGSRWSFLLGWCAFALFWYRDVKSFSDGFFLTEALPAHGPATWVLASLAVLILVYLLGERPWFPSAGIWFAVTVALLPLGQYALFKATADNYVAESVQSTELESRPDIYFLMVDGFGRQDVLQELFDIDTSGFVADLRRNGFVVADRAMGAHPMTWFSIPAIMDQEYQAQPGSQGRPTTTRRQVSILAGASRTHQILLDNGYHFVTAADGSFMVCNTSPISEIEDCVVNRPDIDAAIQFSYVRYQIAFMTPLMGLVNYGLLPNAIALLWQGPTVFTDEASVGGKMFLTRDVLDVVEAVRLRDDLTPLFVYAHMMYTHPPFTLDPECRFQTRGVPDLSSGWENVSGYQDGIDCTVKQILELIGEVDPSAVIVIQADHGPSVEGLGDPDDTAIEGLWAKASVLSAVRLPESCRPLVSDTYAGVNTFKVIFACLAGDPKPEVPERSYWTWYDTHKVVDLTDELRTYEAFRN